MKKVICLLLCLILTVSIGSTVALAASNSDKLNSDIYSVMSDSQRKLYYPQTEKIINQLTISDSQYAQLKAILDDVCAKLGISPSSTRHSVHQFSTSEANYGMAKFEEAMAILGCTYKIIGKANTVHKGDIIAVIYGPDGSILGTLDGDISPNKTDSAVPSWAWALLAGAFAVAASGVVVFARKKVTE